MWVFTKARPPTQVNQGVRPTTHPTSVHEAGKTKAQPPTLPYTSEPTENQIIVADVRGDWADTMDHATTDITPIGVPPLPDPVPVPLA
jgi:hypothetical protein